MGRRVFHSYVHARSATLSCGSLIPAVHPGSHICITGLPGTGPAFVPPPKSPPRSKGRPRAPPAGVSQLHPILDKSLDEMPHLKRRNNHKTQVSSRRKTKGRGSQGGGNRAPRPATTTHLHQKSRTPIPLSLRISSIIRIRGIARISRGYWTPIPCISHRIRTGHPGGKTRAADPKKLAFGTGRS